MMRNKDGARTGGLTGAPLKWAVGIAVIGYILFFLSRCSKPDVCAIPGCTDTCAVDSQYCVSHDLGVRNHGDPTYYEKHKNKNSEEKQEAQSGHTPSRKADSATNHNPKKKKSSVDDDPYNVNDYYDAEDFYEDNYDDFWEYEEAEEYYNTHHEDP